MTQIPERMRALVLKEDGFSGRFEGPAIDDAHRWLELAELPVPQPGPGQVLLRVRRATVNPSDLHFIKGEYGQPRRKGTPAGFEGCGDVVAAGPGAEGLLGRRVAFVATPDGSGAWADYALTAASAAIPLADAVSDADGAALIVNPLTAMAMIDLAAEGSPAVVLTAAGSQLGKLMIALARDRDLAPIAVIRRAEQAPALEALGAAEVLVTTAPDFRERAAAAMRAHKPRVLLDAVADDVSAALFEAMPAHARWVVYGKLDPTPPRVTAMGQLIFMGKRIEGFWLSRWLAETPRERQAEVVAEVQRRFADGRWHTDVAAELPLAEALDRLPEALRAGGKVQILP
ncbi:MAG: zinc-binding dehydrogenase [Alphaproteobacteria bacterium]|nr:MAG: zinc-binding dehydrogenase [Alphaproteobacteria bacterium]